MAWSTARIATLAPPYRSGGAVASLLSLWSLMAKALPAVVLAGAHQVDAPRRTAADSDDTCQLPVMWFELLRFDSVRDHLPSLNQQLTISDAGKGCGCRFPARVGRQSLQVADDAGAVSAPVSIIGFFSAVAVRAYSFGLRSLGMAFMSSRSRFQCSAMCEVVPRAGQLVRCHRRGEGWLQQHWFLETDPIARVAGQPRRGRPGHEPCSTGRVSRMSCCADRINSGEHCKEGWPMSGGRLPVVWRSGSSWAAAPAQLADQAPDATAEHSYADP